MLFQIDPDTVKRTSKCGCEFECLSKNIAPQCKVECCFKEDYAFLKDCRNNACTYLIPYGASFICSCPIRCEIYRKYGK